MVDRRSHHTMCLLSGRVESKRLIATGEVRAITRKELNAVAGRIRAMVVVAIAARQCTVFSLEICRGLPKKAGWLG